MSGPIVRRYGFPNFEQIFGKKELQHGVDEPEAPAPAGPAKDAPAALEKPADSAGAKSEKK
jgi:hypothetical protein